jgi:acyl-CoA synthetase (AMP-forming)/AMP-acid ligase II
VWGEALTALIVAAGSGVDPEELRSFCRERLAGFKVPATFDFTDELPRQPTGKLYKRLLRERYTVSPAAKHTEGETA